MRHGCPVFSEQIKDDNLIPAVAQPRARDIERLLRAHVPKAAEGMSIDPNSAFAKGVNVEKSIAGRAQLKEPTEENRPRFRAGIRPVLNALDFAQWQTEYLPPPQRFSIEKDLARDALEFIAHDGLRVDATGVFTRISNRLEAAEALRLSEFCPKRRSKVPTSFPFRKMCA